MGLQDRIKAFQEKREAEGEKQRQKQLANLAAQAEKVDKKAGQAETLKVARAKVVVAHERLAKAKEPVAIKVTAKAKTASTGPSFRDRLKKVGAFLDTAPRPKKAAAPKRKRAKAKIHRVTIGKTTLTSRHPIKIAKKRKTTKKKKR